MDNFSALLSVPRISLQKAYFTVKIYTCLSFTENQYTVMYCCSSLVPRPYVDTGIGEWSDTSTRVEVLYMLDCGHECQLGKIGKPQSNNLHICNAHGRWQSMLCTDADAPIDFATKRPSKCCILLCTPSSR